jgi:hypothetical protein
MSAGFGNLPPGCTGAGCESAANIDGIIVAAANNTEETCKGSEVFFIEGNEFGLEPPKIMTGLNGGKAFG